MEKEERGKRALKDGIYDLSRVRETLYLEDSEDHHVWNWQEEGVSLGYEEADRFMERYPEFRIAHAYQTYCTILLSDPPEIFGGIHKGGGFNYGSTNLLEDCPRSILILAEDD